MFSTKCSTISFVGNYITVYIKTKLGEKLLKKTMITVLFISGILHSADMGISSHGLDFGFPARKHFKFTMSPKVLFSIYDRSSRYNLVFSPGLDITFRCFNIERKIFNLGLVAGARSTFNITVDNEYENNSYYDEPNLNLYELTFDFLSFEPEIKFTERYSVYMYLPLFSWGSEGFNIGFKNQNYLKAGFRIQLGEKRANKIVYYEKEVVDSGIIPVKERGCKVTVSTFDRKNTISLDGENVTDNRVFFNLGTGTYTFTEETENGVVINTEEVKISKFEKEKRVKLGGRKTTFYIAPSMTLVSPGLGDPGVKIDAENTVIQYWSGGNYTAPSYTEPEGYAIYVAPGIHFAMLHSRKHYNALTFHLNLGSIVFDPYTNDNNRYFSEKQQNSYVGGFLTYMRQWYLNDFFNVAFGPHFGFHYLQTVYSYKDGFATGGNTLDYDETMTIATYTRYEMGGLSFKLGVDVKKIFIAANISLNLGFANHSFYDYYWDTNYNDWNDFNHDRFLEASKFSLTPEINFMVGTRL